MGRWREDIAEGVAYLFELTASDAVQRAALAVDDDALGFGLALAWIAADQVVVGAPGAAVVHHFALDAQSSSWTRIQTVAEPAQSMFGEYGFGETIVVVDDSVYIAAPRSQYYMGSLPSFLHGGHVVEVPLRPGPAVDLRVSLASIASPAGHEPFDLRYSIHNAGDDAATDVQVVIRLSVFDDLAGIRDCSPLREATVSCAIGALAPNETRDVVVPSVVRSSFWEYTGYARSDQPDPDTRNNRVAHTITATEPPMPGPIDDRRSGSGSVGGSLILALLVLTVLRAAPAARRTTPPRY
jgi:hypothetical protein